MICIIFLWQLKANIQLMIADYKDMCIEREELLHSLADVSILLQFVIGFEEWSNLVHFTVEVSIYASYELWGP